ncbi:hypothetical protein KPL70_011596 [Citrus sinensis]|nr:hypothetical protein KPL70_011596 [Citrus sinensis]
MRLFSYRLTCLEPTLSIQNQSNGKTSIFQRNGFLQGAAPPAIPKQLEPNTELQHVTQYSDGKVKLSFRRSTSSRFSDKESCSSIPSLERKFTKVHSVINLPYQPVKSQPRFSTSDIHSSSIRSVDYATSIPHPIYTSSQHEQRQDEKEPSPLTSPTFSAVTENVSKISQKIVQESKSDFAKAIREQLDRIEAVSSSSSKVQIAPDTPQSSKIGVLEHDQTSIASSDLEAFKEESTPKANKIHWELAFPTVKSPPDLAIDNKPSALNQSRFNAASVYEWNIDGISEYNILGLLQQMTMAANAYKTQSKTSDKAIAEILIAGFTGQLKGEKVRNSIKALYDNRISYDELTYVELVSFINKEGLKICQDLKLQKRLKWELRKSKQELAKYCKMNRKLQELGLDEEILSKVAPLLVESSDSESSMSGDSNSLQVDELIDSDTSAYSSSDSESDSYLKKINVLTKDQETFLELVKHICDPNLQKEYLDKLLKTLDFNKAETSKIPIVKKSSYDLTEILDKKKTKKTIPNIQDLQKEIKDIKLEIRELKEKQKNDSQTIQLLL